SRRSSLRPRPTYSPVRPISKSPRPAMAIRRRLEELGASVMRAQVEAEDSPEWRQIGNAVSSLQQVSCDYQLLDFACPFVNLRDLGVAVEPLGGVFVHVAGAAQDLHAAVGAAHRHAGGQQLGLRRLEREPARGLLLERRAPGEQPG